MHAEAWTWLEASLGRYETDPVSVLEFGSRDVNGTARGLFTKARYTGVDIEPGPGVDVVCDAADWPEVHGDDGFDIVLCTEVLEHSPRWQEIIGAAFYALRNGGRFFVTCATDPREPHSASDGGPLQPGEYYENVGPLEAKQVAERVGFFVPNLTRRPRGDLYMIGVR